MVKKIEEMSYDPELIGLYDKEQMDNLVNGINLADAEKRGIEQGSNQRNFEIAKNMLNRNMDMETIVEITGLTKDEIENLK